MSTNRMMVNIEGFGEVPVIVSPKELAAIAGLSNRYTQALCQSGRIPSLQTGRNGRYHIPTLKALKALGLVTD